MNGIKILINPDEVVLHPTAKGVPTLKDIQQQLLESWFPSLVDLYESGQPNRWITIACSMEEYEPVREFLASQVAQGLLKAAVGGGYRLTNEGYLKYAARVKAHRALST